jgi:hypothetical protein
VSAVTIMLAAWGLLILTHWANSEPTINERQIIEMVFAVLLIAFLEGIPQTAPIAQGLAWLFLAAVLLSNKSVLTALAKRTGTGTSAPAKA